ncbi:MAG: serine hydrolase domain-containing protein, partial [Candidatus Hydrogenedentota bacterium]
LGEGWSKATAEQEGAVTVRHLMTMTSGLSAELEYQVPPGSRWRYNTNAYAKTTKVLEAAVDKDMNALTAEWLTGPTGMRESKWEPRTRLEAAVEANSIGFVTSARDLARFGLLILAGAKWNDTDLLSNPAYLKESLSPSQKLNPAYGLLWWLNGQSSYVEAAGGERVEGTMNPAAPADLVQAAGALGRKCYIVPSLGLVVTRLGDQPGDPGFDEKFWERLMKVVKP